MKVKTKGLLKAENEYLINTLFYFIKAIKEANIEPFKSEIQYVTTKFTEYHKVLIGDYMMCYDLEKLYDLKDTTIAHKINNKIGEINNKG